ncbi:MAG: mechanosensitive ion channel family protein [Thermoplasmatota archaeon]
MNIMGALQDVWNYQLGTGGPKVWEVAQFVLIIVAAIVIARVIRTNIRRIMKERVPKNTLSNMEKLVYYTIVFVGFVIAMSTIGFSLSGLLVAGGIMGIVIGFASQTVVSNLISGLFLIIEKPIKIGDGVNIDDVAGIVEDVRILSTTIRTYDGIYTRLPNEKVFSSNIQNYVAHGARRFAYSVGIRYRDDADQAKEIITNLLESHPLVLKNPAPQVFVEELGNSSVNLKVRMWAPSTHWYGVYTEMLWKIKVALEKEGIQIPFPQRVVWFADTLKGDITTDRQA